MATYPPKNVHPGTLPSRRGRPYSSSEVPNIGFSGNVFFLMVTSKPNMAHVYISDLECPKSISISFAYQLIDLGKPNTSY